jgi:DNA-binding response OmpR family regulator
MLQLLEAKFVQEGFDVTSAASPPAFRRALSVPPDLVVLEQRLVDEEGRPLLATLRDSDRLSDVPLILLTVRDASAAEGAALSMPFRPKQLVALARDTL